MRAYPAKAVNLAFPWGAALGCLLLSHPFAVHAEPLTRGAAIARAMNQNPQVAAARAVVGQAEARQDQVEAARFPSVTLLLGTGPSLKADLVPGTAAKSRENTYGDVGWDDLTVSFAGDLQVIQPLYTFGKIGHRQQATAHEVAARQAQTDMTRAELAMTVAELYEGLLFARDAARFFQETDQWLSRSIESTQGELEAGSTTVSEQDLLRLKAAVAVIHLGLSQAEAAQRQATAGLVAYLNLDKSATIEPNEATLELLPTPDSPAHKLIDQAHQLRPELRALEHAGSAFEALAEAEQAGFMPDLFAAGFLFGGYTPGRDMVTTRYIQDPVNGFYPGVLVGARLQIDGLMPLRRADENRAKALELQYTREWAFAGMPAEVTKAYEDVRRAKQDADATAESVQSAKKWLVQASADQSIGLGDSRDVADAASAYVQLRVAHFDAKYRHNVALADLARATGTLVGPESPYYPNRPQE